MSVRLWLMLALTFGTGFVDAAGYLGLDRVFVGNMTGNIVILGMGAVGVDGLEDVTTVVATSTLTLFAADLAAKPARAALPNRRVAAIVAVISGAGAGALLLSHLGLGPAMALAATTTGMVAALGHFYFRTATRGSGLPESER